MTRGMASTRTSTPKPVELIKVLVGPAGSSQPFILPRRQLEFYSPFLRHIIERITLSDTICLQLDDPAAFEILVNWMSWDTESPTCHQSAGKLQAKLRSEEDDGIMLAFKVWMLTHRLGGPCLVLRDECMRFLYEEHTAPMLGHNAREITPATALYVFESISSASELNNFVVAVLARVKRPWSSVDPGGAWDDVFEQVPELKTLVDAMWGLPREARIRQLQRMEKYMCTPGEVTPDWWQKQTVGGRTRKYAGSYVVAQRFAYIRISLNS
ncbi:hypothetical protein FB567DRAFT_161915 [Paraphoma chrysanthemicola]|uniref:Uncharacterized protein n=1 Tax=Paraphoma chrysanthemicola TaxID=798071 RepID=A0A8K0REI2_9PLEO|nr:hypothetical protein FB567DRAFT_161915 [Paraphoma chrysanthemicola]